MKERKGRRGRKEEGKKKKTKIKNEREKGKKRKLKKGCGSEKNASRHDLGPG